MIRSFLRNTVLLFASTLFVQVGFAQDSCINFGGYVDTRVDGQNLAGAVEYYYRDSYTKMAIKAPLRVVPREFAAEMETVYMPDGVVVVVYTAPGFRWEFHLLPGKGEALRHVCGQSVRYYREYGWFVTSIESGTGRIVLEFFTSEVF